MTKSEIGNPTKLHASPQPSLLARLRFFCRRHFLAIHVIVSALIAFPIALVLVVETRPIDEFVDWLIVVQFGLSFTLFFLAFWPLLSSINRPAEASDFEAAFAAADEYELLHLNVKIRQRLSSIILREPMTVEDLAVAFSAVRGEHGKRARKAAKRAEKAKTSQRKFLELRLT